MNPNTRLRAFAMTTVIALAAQQLLALAAFGLPEPLQGIYGGVCAAIACDVVVAVIGILLLRAIEPVIGVVVGSAIGIPLMIVSSSTIVVTCALAVVPLLTLAGAVIAIARRTDRDTRMRALAPLAAAGGAVSLVIAYAIVQFGLNFSLEVNPPPVPGAWILAFVHSAALIAAALWLPRAGGGRALAVVLILWAVAAFYWVIAVFACIPAVIAIGTVGALAVWRAFRPTQPEEADGHHGGSRWTKRARKASGSRGEGESSQLAIAPAAPPAT